MKRISVIFTGIALIISCIWLSRLSEQHTPSAVTFTLIQIVAGMMYLIAIFLIIRKQADISLTYLLAVGIICRLILLPTQPLFDDDIHRYLWDGKVIAHGINPFLYSPLSDKLAHLRDENWAHIGYPTIRTIYPPGAQVLFGLAYVFGIQTVNGLKLVFFMFDLANMGLILALLNVLRRPRSWLLVYAWSPLAFKEFANSGHLESVMIFFLLLAFFAWIKIGRRSTLAGICFSLAIMVKLMPLLLLPVVFRFVRWRALALSGLVVTLFYLPFFGAGKLLFSGAAMYARYWEFNGSIFALASGLEHHVLGSYSTLPISPARLAVTLATMICALLLGRGADPSDPSVLIRSTRNVFAAALFLMPTVDPWYVCWLIPLLCIVPNTGLMLFTITCNLSYLYYAHNSFPAWIPFVEYLPVYLLLGTALYLRVSAKSHA